MEVIKMFSLTFLRGQCLGTFQNIIADKENEMEGTLYKDFFRYNRILTYGDYMMIAFYH